MSPAPRHVAVIGAGAFGGWTALWLRRAGARVTLVDAWGPGNSRASSGGDSRVIRSVYGPVKLYVDWVARALELWRESDARWGTRLYTRTGVLWLCPADDRFVRASLPLIRGHGLEVEELEPEDLARRHPEIALDGVLRAYLEREAGYLLARRACEAVARALVDEGGELVEAAARPGPLRGGALESLALSDGSSLRADTYVFACGPWLPTLFPELLDAPLRVSRQELYYFGAPAGDPAWREGGLPVWIDMVLGYYGIPGSERRGFKVADDVRGETFDPTDGDRTPSPDRLRAARGFLARRFPALAEAPLLEARVCQYTNTPDAHLVIDRHPDADNVWLVGGGSGHGFKLGPALGEAVAGWVRGEARPDPSLSVARLSTRSGPDRPIFS